MHFGEYQRRVKESDQRKHGVISLLGLVGETGSVVSTVKKRIRDGLSFTGFKKELREELGDTLWYLTSVASAFGLQLDDIAKYNLQKAKGFNDGAQIKFDARYDSDERLPRKLSVIFKEKRRNSSIYVKLQANGINIGDRLTDNAHDDDGYRYHDAFHLAYAAVLGWSPVLRRILNCKRKSNAKVDEVEDGARAAIIEEAIASHVFNYAADHNFFEGVSAIDNRLYQTIQGLTRGLEVQACTKKQWERAILDGYAVYRALKAGHGGIVDVDLNAAAITFRPLKRRPVRKTGRRR